MKHPMRLVIPSGLILCQGRSPVPHQRIIRTGEVSTGVFFPRYACDNLSQMCEEERRLPGFLEIVMILWERLGSVSQSVHGMTVVVWMQKERGFAGWAAHAVGTARAYIFGCFA